MHNTLKKLFKFIDATEHWAIFIYLIITTSIATTFLKPILLLCMIPIEGSLSAVKSQIIQMCGLVWWGGMNFINYLFWPTSGSCDGFHLTFSAGLPILLGVSIIIVGVVRRYYLNITFMGDLRKTILYFTGGVVLVSVYRLLIGFSPKGSVLFPDSIVLWALVIMVAMRVSITADD